MCVPVMLLSVLARKVVSGNNTDHNNHLVDRCDMSSHIAMYSHIAIYSHIAMYSHTAMHSHVAIYSHIAMSTQNRVKMGTSNAKSCTAEKSAVFFDSFCNHFAPLVWFPRNRRQELHCWLRCNSWRLFLGNHTNGAK